MAIGKHRIHAGTVRGTQPIDRLGLGVEWLVHPADRPGRRVRLAFGIVLLPIVMRARATQAGGPHGGGLRLHPRQHAMPHRCAHPTGFFRHQQGMALAVVDIPRPHPRIAVEQPVARLVDRRGAAQPNIAARNHLGGLLESSPGLLRRGAQLDRWLGQLDIPVFRPRIR